VFMQWLSTINPMTYYLIVIRGTFLKGVGLAVLWPQMLALAALGVILTRIERPQVPQGPGLIFG
jgi:ABC-2 type transport system permease protein